MQHDAAMSFIPVGHSPKMLGLLNARSLTGTARKLESESGTRTY